MVLSIAEAFARVILKTGSTKEVRFKLNYEEFKTKKLSKFDELIEFISSDERAQVMLSALKELHGEV